MPLCRSSRVQNMLAYKLCHETRGGLEKIEVLFKHCLNGSQSFSIFKLTLAFVHFGDNLLDLGDSISERLIIRMGFFGAFEQFSKQKRIAGQSLERFDQVIFQI